MIGTVALAIYWDHTYSGPYRWLAELQLRWIGQYEKTITFLLAVMILLAPFGALFGVYRLVTRGRKGTAPTTPEQPASPTLPPQPPTPSSPRLDVFNRYFMPICIALFGTVMLFLGVQKWHLARNAGEIIHAEARDFEAGNLPGPWVKVTGQPLIEQVLTTDSSQSSQKHYIPLVSSKWEAGAPVAVFVEVSESDDANALRTAAVDGYHGMTQRNGLPGMVRVAFERAGLPPSKDYVMIDFDRSPSDERRIARDCMLFGSGALVLALGWFIYDRLRARRAAAITAAQSPGAITMPRHQIKAIVTVDQNPSQKS